MKRKFTKYPQGYVRASSDFSAIPWKEQPTTLMVDGNEKHYLYWSKDLGNGYYADIKPSCRGIDDILWEATITKYSNSGKHYICGFATFDNAYDAQEWVDKEGDMYIAFDRKHNAG